MYSTRHAYRCGDFEMLGYLVGPGDGLPRPGILLAPEGPGLGAHAHRRAEQIAALGYVVLAVDYYGQGRVAGSHEETLAMAAPLLSDRRVLLARMQSALDVLWTRHDVDEGRICAVGYCLGGLAVLDLARSGAPIAGTVTFHALLNADERIGNGIRGKVLACTGADDHLVPPVDVQAFESEMTAADVDWQLVRYGRAKHAFTNALEAEKLEKIGFGYDALADRRSWAAMHAFFEEALA